METLVQLLFVFAFAKYCLKAALSGSLWRLIGYAAAVAVVAMMLYPVVINQPLTIIADILADRTAVGNIALITTAEAIAGIFISVYLLDNYFKPKPQRTRTAFVLKIIPGLLIFCAIAYFELLFFKYRVGGHFATTAALYATLLFATVFLLGWIAHISLRGESLKLEVKAILNSAILVVGLLISASVADYNLSHAQSPVEWKALGVLTLLASVLIAWGIWFPRFDFKTRFSKWVAKGE